MTKSEILELLWNEPYLIGKWIGFTKLTELHNKWLREFLYSDNDQTLQAHRGSYKTTTLSLFFALHAIIKPNETVLYFRKTGADVAEIARQTANILNSGCVRKIAETLYNTEFGLTEATNYKISTNLATGIKGTSQIVGLGIGTSITGKHADIIVTDDIVNINDRISQAERERTKVAYQEMQNLKNRGGRFINTGTPWHKEDCFTLMPNPRKYDCYTTGLMSNAEISDLKATMMGSLFAANYELRHIAGDDILFPSPVSGAPVERILNGMGHVDSAFYGEDFTAFTIMAYHDGKYYVFGKLWRRHIEGCYADIIQYFTQYNVDKIYTEKNADKGMVARDMKNLGLRVVPYDEHMNKHIKIATYLKAIWKDVIFVEGTDAAYIEQIEDYTDNAQHDDAPDSAACLARLIYPRVTRHEGRRDVVAEILKNKGGQ